MRKIDLLAILLICLALSFILYGNTIKGDFVYDDYNFVTRQELRNGSHFLKLWTEPYLPDEPTNGTYRPLSIASFALNFSLFGESPVSFHVVNIVLNGLVIFLVYMLIIRLFNNIPLSIFTALIFAFMPIHSETVALIKSRDEILRTVFILLAWLSFLKAVTQKKLIDWKIIILSCTLFFLAMLAKETAIIVPFLFLTVSWLQKKLPFGKIGKLALPYGLIATFYMFVRFLVLGKYAFGSDDLNFIFNPLRSADITSRIYTAFQIAYIYISKTFIPFGLSATYHFRHLTPVSRLIDSWQSGMGIVFILILVFMMLYKKTRVMPLGIGAAIFLIPYFIISRFVFLAGEIMAERMLYFPSLGLALITGYFLEILYRKKRTIAIVSISAILIFYAFITISRTNIWLSRLSLAQSMINDAPESIQGYFMMASYYFNMNDIEMAKSYAQKAYAIYPDFPKNLYLLGRIETTYGNYEEAEKYYLRALEIYPQFTAAQKSYNLLLKKKQ